MSFKLFVNRQGILSQEYTTGLLWSHSKSYTLAVLEPGSSVPEADAMCTAPRRQGKKGKIPKCLCMYINGPSIGICINLLLGILIPDSSRIFRMCVHTFQIFVYIHIPLYTCHPLFCLLGVFILHFIFHQCKSWYIPTFESVFFPMYPVSLPLELSLYFSKLYIRSMTVLWFGSMYVLFCLSQSFFRDKIANNFFQRFADRW
jgi:hypothetical protein